MLKVTIHNAESVPNSAHLTNVNLMVAVIFRGVRRQTSWQRLTDDTKWNETLAFPLNGTSIKDIELLNIYLNDHENIEANKFLGRGTISLNDIIDTSMIKHHLVQLTNLQGIPLEATKLYLTIEYLQSNGNINEKQILKNDLTRVHDISLQNGGEMLWKSGVNIDPTLQLQSKQWSNKAQDFQIRVKVFQARQLDGSNIHPVCRVRVINSLKQTQILKGTNHPYFNEVFFFNIHMSEAELCDQMIEFEVCNSRTIRSDMRIGTFKIDIASIYSQSKHSINRKWLLLSNENDRMAGAKGYLKVSVNILGPGDEAPSQEKEDDYDDIESNLLQPAGLMLRPATFLLKIYKAEDLPRMDTAFLHGVKKMFNAVEDMKELIDPYIQFSFAGQQVSSKIIYTCSHPEFNQELRLALKFPSMCDKITLTVMDWDRLQPDDITGSTLININSICDDRENGFLPTFGPCWINLYGAPREYSEFRTALDELNTGKDEGVAYRGRIFVELQTILGEIPVKSIDDISNSDLIRTLPFQSRKKYKLHAAFLDASMLYEHQSAIEFEVSIGNYGNKFDDLLGNGNCSTTPPTNPVFDGTSYYFLPWEHTKPCVQIVNEWEDITFRLEAMNQLLKTKLFITGLMSTLDSLKSNRLSEEILLQHYRHALDMIISRLKKPLPDLESGRFFFNELDRLRRDMRTKDLLTMVHRLEQLKIDGRTSEEIIDVLEEIRQNLEHLHYEPQNSIPDVIIWLISNGKRYAYYRLQANEVFYSTNSEYRGHYCGKIQTVTLKWPGKESHVDKDKRYFIPAEVRVKIWFGLAIHEHDWLSQQKGADLVIFAETYENQINVLGQWSTHGPLLSRPAWSDVTGNVNLLKENFQVPPGWRWEDDWYVSPETSARYADDAGHKKFTEEVYENQSRLIAGAQWQTKTVGWTDLVGDKVESKDKRIDPPDGWEWEDDWTIDTKRAVDQEGFEYCVNQTLSGWCPVENLFHLNRRRRWYRTRVLKEETKRKVAEVEVKTEGWEYAPMFNMKFHADERSLDMTRRRRWHRKMVPDGSLFDRTITTDSPKATLPSTDIVFRMQSSVAVATDALTRNKEMKIELSSPRIFLSFKRAYYYELRAYIYQARNLLSMDHDSFSDPYAQLGFINQSQRTEVIQKTLCPTWDQTLIFSNVELYGEPDEIHHNPPNILIELFDKDEYGAPDFLGRVQCSPIVRLTPDENKPIVKLKWFPIKRGTDSAGELLAAFELFRLSDTINENRMVPQPSKRGLLFIVPEAIRPELVRTGIEILCWGLRNMKTYMLSDVDCPQVLFEVGGQQIQSTVLKNAKKTLNFDKPLLFLDVMLPKEDLYAPSMNIKVKDHRSFGRKPIVGFHIIKSLQIFRCDPTVSLLTLAKTTEQSALPASLENTESQAEHRKQSLLPTTNEIETNVVDKKKLKKQIKQFLRKSKSSPIKPESKWTQIQKTVLKHQHKHQNLLDREVTIVEDDIDWWSKYHASKGETNKCGSYLTKGYEILTIYPHPLESHGIYQGFTDFCQTFELFRGKTKFEEENETIGEFKGLLKVYPLPDDHSEVSTPRVMDHFPSNHCEECLVRVYIIRGIDLQPKDSNGKSDPYIEIQLGKNKFDNRDERIPNTTNPIFGKMFEMKTIIPLNKDLIIRIKDWDLISSDDIIGQTTIDLENRFLSKYRPICGLPLQYNLTGVNQWRDSVRPRKILADVCKRNNIPLPELLDDQSIQIGGTIFHLNDFEQEKELTIHAGESEERLALHILHKLSLCPEHIETRPLFNSLQPSIEQGRLELFVDIFPKSQGPPGPPSIMTPRKPKPYVLRCIVWNTSDVVLQETSITGEKMSDIYVKGWITGVEEDVQNTDVHYRSMDGVGNFNWRFVYNFDYFPAERFLSIKKKEHFWSYDSTELTMPPILNLQIWDNDQFSPDDFLGTLTLNLNHLHKPTKDSDDCTLKMLDEKSVDIVSIFEIKRLKGWWPCVDLENGTSKLTGKIELELEILTEEEAKERPAGRARDKPNQHPKLESPQRPQTSFLWFTSPYRTFKNILWKKSKWYIIGILLFAILIIFIVLFLWSLPNAILSRLLHPLN